MNSSAGLHPVRGVGEKARVARADARDEARPLRGVARARHRRELGADAEHLHLLLDRDRHVVVHEDRVALEPAVGAGRPDLGAPGAVLHIHVGLEHHLQPERVHLVDGAAHHVVVVRAVGDGPDVVRVLPLHVPGGEKAAPARAGRREGAPGVARRRGAVLVVPPRDVGDGVVLEPGAEGGGVAVGVGLDGLPPPPPQAAIESESARTGIGEVAGASDRGRRLHRTPVWVRQEAGTHRTSPAPRPPVPTTRSPEQEGSGSQPAVQPMTRETRRR